MRSAPCPIDSTSVSWKDRARPFWVRLRGSALRSPWPLAEAGRRDVGLIHGRTSRDRAEQVADEIRNQGRRSAVLMANLADRDAGDRLVDEAWGLWDGLDA